MIVTASPLFIIVSAWLIFSHVTAPSPELIGVRKALKAVTEYNLPKNQVRREYEEFMLFCELDGIMARLEAEVRGIEMTDEEWDKVINHVCNERYKAGLDWKVDNE